MLKVIKEYMKSNPAKLAELEQLLKTEGEVASEAVKLATELQKTIHALEEALVLMKSSKQTSLNNASNIIVALLTSMGGEVKLGADLVKAVVGGEATFKVVNHEDGSSTLTVEASCEPCNCDSCPA